MIESNLIVKEDNPLAGEPLTNLFIRLADDISTRLAHLELYGELLGLCRVVVAPNHEVFLVYTLELLLVSVEFFSTWQKW